MVVGSRGGSHSASWEDGFWWTMWSLKVAPKSGCLCGSSQAIVFPYMVHFMIVASSAKPTVPYVGCKNRWATFSLVVPGPKNFGKLQHFGPLSSDCRTLHRRVLCENYGQSCQKKIAICSAIVTGSYGRGVMELFTTILTSRTQRSRRKLPDYSTSSNRRGVDEKTIRL